MYTPPAFRDEDKESLRATIRAARLANFVTATADGPLATPLPLFLDESEGEHGVIYGHLAKANPQWRVPPVGDALAIFMGPDAYITPSWYATKQETGKVVPTWNYVTVHAYGRPQIVEDTQGALDVLAKLAAAYEGADAASWGLDRLPPGNAEAQTRGIVAFRMPIARLQTKIKLSQNRDLEDRQRVIAKLEASDNQDAQATAHWMKSTLK